MKRWIGTAGLGLSLLMGAGLNGCHNLATPTLPGINTPTSTVTTAFSPTSTNTKTITPTPTVTNSPTITDTPGGPTNTPSSTPTITSTPTVTNTPTITSTSGSAFATCTSTTTPDLINDFDANSSSGTGLLANQCRDGVYYVFDDGSGGGSPLAQTISSPGTGFSCGSGSSINAIHLTGGPFAGNYGGYGSFFSIALVQSGTYDISSFTGVQFCGLLGPTTNATGPSVFQIITNPGNDAINIPVFTTSWATYTLPFSSATGSGNLALTTVFQWITTSAHSTQPADYFIDNISFY